MAGSRRQRKLEQERKSQPIPARREEQLLIPHLTSLKAERILCRSLGRGQLAGCLASFNPESLVDCHFLDVHYEALAREYWEEADHPPHIICSPDFPDEEYDAVCICVQKQGDAELTRDLLQQGFLRLKEGGVFYSAVDAPQDRWLHEQMQSLFPKVTRIPKKQGVIYSGIRKGDLKRIRSFDATFTFRWQEREFVIKTRPGVFSHRRLDGGAWALIKSLNPKPGSRILELGCGCGAVSLAAMHSAPGLQVTALDSHARAVQVTRENAQANLDADQLARFHVIHAQAGPQPRPYDVVLANPPYFSKYSIAREFVRTAWKCLSLTGELLIVTKSPEWFQEHLQEMFQNVNVIPQGDYAVVKADRKTVWAGLES